MAFEIQNRIDIAYAQEANIGPVEDNGPSRGICDDPPEIAVCAGRNAGVESTDLTAPIVFEFRVRSSCAEGTRALLFFLFFYFQLRTIMLSAEKFSITVKASGASERAADRRCVGRCSDAREDAAANDESLLQPIPGEGRMHVQRRVVAMVTTRSFPAEALSRKLCNAALLIANLGSVLEL